MNATLKTPRTREDGSGTLRSSIAIAMILSLLLGSVSVMPASAQDGGVALAEALYDLTGDGVVTNADTMEVVLAWTTAREEGNPCSGNWREGADVTGDGCMTVADVQAMAAREGLAIEGAAVQGQADAKVLAATPLTFTVNSTSDSADSNEGDGVCRTSGGVCTLRAAIVEANLNAGPDTIAFNIPGSGPHEIRINSELPTINDETGGTTINGYTQPGSSPNTNAVTSNAVIRIQIVGPRTSSDRRSIDAIRITSPNNVVRGLSLVRLRRSIWISGARADNNVVAGNFVGLYANGTGWANWNDRIAMGVVINYSGKGNRIGGTDPADRNIISGNANDGIAFSNEGTENNVIIGNIIGLSPNGQSRVRNTSDGIDFNYGAAHNRIGGHTAAERNVISGNGSEGIEISHDPSTAYNEVIGNFVGTDVTGRGGSTSVHRNPGFGVSLEDRSSHNRIGPGNVIANNGRGGMEMYGNGSNGNQIFGNKIGVNVDGQPFPNGGWGIRLRYHASNVTIGPDNIIAHNNGDGIWIVDPNVRFNTVTRNSIYRNAGLGIDIDPDGVNGNDQYAHSGANGRQNFPVISSATTKEVKVSACAGCVVEIFIADGSAGGYGEGRTFVGSAVADGNGIATVPVSGVTAGQIITSTATAPDRNTSEFSLNVAVTEAPSDPVAAVPGIIQAEDYKAGGEGVGYHDTTSGNTGGRYRSDDVDISTCTDATTASGQTCHRIGWVDAGEWTAYDVNVAKDGWYAFTLRAAAPSNNRTFHLEVDGINITGPVTVTGTGSYSTYADTAIRAVWLAAGHHELRLVADTPNFNWNYLRVAEASVPQDNPPTAEIVTPMTEAMVSGTGTVGVEAFDDLDTRGSLTVEVAVDGAGWQRAPFSGANGRYELAWNTTSHANGYHTLVARATDSGGHSAESDAVRVAVNNVVGTPASAVQVPARIEAEDYRDGGPGIGYYDTTTGNSGNRYRTSEDVDVQACTDVASGSPCFNVGWIRVGEWLAYDVIVPSDGAYVFTFRVASSSSGRSFKLEMDGQNVSGTIAVPSTGGSSTWGDVSTSSIQLSAGVHTIRFVSNSSSFNLNYIEVTRQ